MAHAAATTSSAACRTRRTSVTLPAQLHRELERIAKRKKVSIAWVIRDAIESYIDAKYPLFSQKTDS